MPASASEHLLLAGGGHSHALLLRRWAMQPQRRPPGLITLVSRSRTSLYSGMIPGLIAGDYQPGDVSLDLAALADRAGVAFVQAEITGIDPHSQQLRLQDRPALHYERLSCNLGCITPALEGSQAIKPLEPALAWLDSQDAEDGAAGDRETPASPFTVVGSGLAALEVVLALRQRWPQRRLQLQARNLDHLPASLRTALKNARIQLLAAEPAGRGPVLNCSGSRAPAWLAASGLPCDGRGRLRTNTSLQVLGHPEILAAGDCAVIDAAPRPPSGVWAVRAARPLARSLESLAAGRTPPPWYPQRRALQLLGNRPQAWALWGPLWFGPQRWLWRWKQRIDRRFMARLQPHSAMTGAAEGAEQAAMLCRGCAAKLPAQPLQRALTNAGLDRLGRLPEDAQSLGHDDQGQLLLQSVDGFPALLSDPWRNGRLTALHACSDLWACGALPRSAQAVVTLPAVAEGLQQHLLGQSLAGIRDALSEQGAELIGGHTLEARNSGPEATPSPISLGLQISLSVQGAITPERFWPKRGLQAGDQLWLSRPLGTGVLFAAAMAGVATAADLERAQQQMNQSQHELVEALQGLQRHDPGAIHAATDITGFGLLGHLLEMLPPDRSRRLQLHAETIPALPGALGLLTDGIASSLAPANRLAWRALEPDGDQPAAVTLQLGAMTAGSSAHQALLELLVDPQTCGPLLIACTRSFNDRIRHTNPGWRPIGSVL
ncbi:bifunctional selenide/ water dikinase / oxidoreductase fusion protein [Synechococcus sp. RS9909]|uniref:selenide, water dikinase SelD n=1 Tax=Synechococcus sp. RS9909 TaxID=221352 RepID=UPI000069060E|nr:MULTISPECIES: selenide, water dikinase SelD [unclassified Synechococcus]EAQ70122.1 Selenide,water dikinase [Synechococcus sp. RS9917]QNI78222.1 bifunctional selenide/ water dikinase / oxidoreductase fusion protein [Synechococcus sp. RS9909]